MDRFTLRTDGGSRGNPGPAAMAFVLEAADGAVVAQGGRYLGRVTNNVAEYRALLWGLESAADHGADPLSVLLDSELIVKQINGEYRVKDPKMRELHARATSALGDFTGVSVSHIQREENAAADALVNEALDTHERGAGRDATGPSSTPCVYELTVKTHFDAAHELAGYPGECKNLHGHTWDVEATVTGSHLDEVGIVYDFKRLKEDLSSILEPFDHAHLNEIPPFDRINPTAENLAREICDSLQERVGEEVTVTAVGVWESPIAKIVYRPV